MLLEQVATCLNTTPDRLEHDSLRVYLEHKLASLKASCSC